MSIFNDEIVIEDIGINASEIYEHVQKLVLHNVINEQTRDECIYHLNKLVGLFGIDDEFDSFANEFDKFGEE